MYVCMSVCMFVCLYVCMSVCLCVLDILYCVGGSGEFLLDVQDVDIISRIQNHGKY
jgi:hypothetical protein